MAGLRGSVTPGYAVRVEVFRAPWVWGPSDGTTAGELFRIAYTGETPDSATLELADGRLVTLTVAGGVLSGLLPTDTPQGPGVVRTVGRRAQQITVALAGVTVVADPVGPPRPRTVTGSGPRVAPARRAPTPRRVIRDRSVLEIQTLETIIRTTLSDRTEVALRSRVGAMIRTPPPPPRLVREDVAIHISEREYIRTVQPTSLAPSIIAVEETAMSIRRRDGRQREEALLLSLL